MSDSNWSKKLLKGVGVSFYFAAFFELLGIVLIALSAYLQFKFEEPVKAYAKTYTDNAISYIIGAISSPQRATPELAKAVTTDQSSAEAAAKVSSKDIASWRFLIFGLGTLSVLLGKGFDRYNSIESLIRKKKEEEGLMSSDSSTLKK